MIRTINPLVNGSVVESFGLGYVLTLPSSPGGRHSRPGICPRVVDIGALPETPIESGESVPSKWWHNRASYNHRYAGPGDEYGPNGWV